MSEVLWHRKYDVAAPLWMTVLGIVFRWVFQTAAVLHRNTIPRTVIQSGAATSYFLCQSTSDIPQCLYHGSLDTPVATPLDIRTFPAHRMLCTQLYRYRRTVNTSDVSLRGRMIARVFVTVKLTVL